MNCKYYGVDKDGITTLCDRCIEVMLKNERIGYNTYRCGEYGQHAVPAWTYLHLEYVEKA